MEVSPSISIFHIVRHLLYGSILTPVAIWDTLNHLDHVDDHG